MPKRRQTTPLPVIICTVFAPIPELDLKTGDRIVVENLGSPGGAVLHRELDTDTAQLILNHASVSLVPVPRRRWPDRRQRLDAPAALHLEA